MPLRHSVHECTDYLVLLTSDYEFFLPSIRNTEHSGSLF